MGMTLVVMTGEEEFLQFLDPELCTLTETHEKQGLRTLDLDYKFQDLHSDKQLFKIGNKIWVSNDTNLTDCLYVINTPVTTDVYDENSFHCTMEEVLVELNYAPLFTQNELTSSNGFNITTTNGEQSVKVDWNALHYWFGKYFNIGVVQDCLNKEYNKISFNGTQTLMGLLRYIEDETGNVFVTRYEKDCLNNTIHRYLDFLNPLDVSKNWVLNLEYDFVSEDLTGEGVYDSDGNPTTDTYDDVENEDDIVDFTTDYTPITNVDPDNIQFRITNEEGLVLNSDGRIYTSESETPLIWDSEDIDFGDYDYTVINLSMNHGTIGLICNEKTFVLPSSTTTGVTPESFVSVWEDPETYTGTTLPDDSYFEIYDFVNGRPVFRTCINREIGHVHEEVLDFGFNLENVTFETDEEDTFTAISPVLSLEEGSDGLSRTDMGHIITNWKNLSISKGATIPMILEKVTVQASSLANAISSMGAFSVSGNYYARPYKPNDNIDANTPSNSTWEFWRATAYWKAPFTKISGDIHLNSNSYFDNEYTTIYGRPDIRDDYCPNTPKMGTVETSEEDIYAIYNDVALKLKDKMYREFNIEVDVANLIRQGEYNNYELHDKVYVKLPDYTDLVTARVVKTTKEAHDVAKNTVELSNYTSNIIKTTLMETCIQASNTSFKYPSSKEYKVRLENLDYDPYDTYSVHYPANKLINMVLYKVDDNNDNATLTKTYYNKRTDGNGYATINMKYDPGNYKLKISFGGDEEYEDSSITIDINVSGTKEIVEPVDMKKYKPKDLTKSKPTKKTSISKAKTRQTKRYYSKYGVSPDNKYLMAVGRPSASGELAKYGYKYYKVVFKRKCPFCGSTELYWNIFWTGNEHSSTGKNPAVGRRKSGSAEGEITCKKCDADFSIFGKDKATTPRKSLTMYKKAVKSSKAEAYTLKKGAMYYDTLTETIKTKKVTSTKTRVIPSGVSVNEKVKKQALSIVGDSTGLAAAKKIAKWCGHRGNLKYDYYANFHRQPSTVLSKHSANCCDSARFMLNMMAAAGCMSTLKLQFVHVIKPGTNTGHVFAKVTELDSGKWRYVDPVLKLEKGTDPWGHYYKGCGTTIAHISDYPALPF